MRCRCFFKSDALREWRERVVCRLCLKRTGRKKGGASISGVGCLEAIRQRKARKGVACLRQGGAILFPAFTPQNAPKPGPGAVRTYGCEAGSQGKHDGFYLGDICNSLIL